MAHSSPIESWATSWNAPTKSCTVSRSIRPSVWEMIVVATS